MRLAMPRFQGANGVARPKATSILEIEIGETTSGRLWVQWATTRSKNRGGRGGEEEVLLASWRVKL